MSHSDQKCRTGDTLADILGDQVHRANCNGAFYFPGGDVRLFVPDAATIEQLKGVREFLSNLILAHDSDQGGT